LQVSASQLFSDGQLSSVFADMPSLDAALLSVCRNQLLCAPGAVRLVKRAVFDVHSSPDSESQRQQLVRALFATMMASPEAAHGMAAFMAKRDPEWPAFAKAKL
jgi:1,4-dihydroxy-2-naphthoyl-CoA synthase